MRKTQWQFTIIALIAFFMSAYFLVPAQTGSNLFERTTRQGSIKPSQKTTVIRAQNILVNLDFFRLNTTKELTVDLFGQKFSVLLERETPTAEGKGFVWYGRIQGQLASYVMLSRVGNTLAGSLYTQNNHNYQIRYLGNGIHVLYEIDQTKFPNDEPKGFPKKTATNPGNPSGDTCGSDNPSDIDVMVAYTATARAAAGGNDAMQAEVYLATELTNQSYINSNITQRLRLVHLVEVAYTESGVSNTDKVRMQNPSDGQLDNLLPLRNAHAADLVALIVNNLDYCGEAFDILNPVSNAFENKAYTVVEQGCSAGNLSFAHELGHLMGARHNWANDGANNAPYPYNHGYFNIAPTPMGTPSWRTIMSYKDASCPASGCARIPYWSNPTIRYPTATGDPMGVATGSQQTDNRTTLNNTALTVSNFRCSSPNRANVWIKDTWEDTGAEPDPATASQDMWKSPYIWVRKTQDTGLTHQHQHENPVFGSGSFVYTKLHNGANTPSTGTLEVYWANASTSLSWPTGWTNLANIALTIQANSTKIVEAPWTSLPATGHFCLLARWVSASDPMASPETNDIEQNVRKNNNLAWRNLNIVSLADAPRADESLILRGVNPDFRTSLQVKATRTTLGGSFLAEGQIIVTFDDVLQRAWERGGSRGKGFRQVGKNFLITNASSAIFENISLKENQIGQVHTSFQTFKERTPQRTYLIDMIQLAVPFGEGGDSKPRVIGGVSYQISTEPNQK